MKIYRTETRGGTGAFEALSTLDYAEFEEVMKEATGSNHYDSTRYPSPYYENWHSSPLSIDDHRFGCQSLALWVDWFPPACREYLAERGLELAIYEVPEERTATGDHQVVFDPNFATEVARYPIGGELPPLALTIAA